MDKNCADRRQHHQQQHQHPQQHCPRLKGATKFLSNRSVTNEQEPNKVSPDRGNTDSTTSMILSNDSIRIPPTISNHNNHHHAQMLYMVNGPDSAHPSSVASSSTNRSTSSCINNIPNLDLQQSQVQDSPQILPCDIKSLFECPICFDYVVPPIHQCQNGHIVCKSCSSKITDCPTCRVPISEPSIRNLQLDRLASTFQFPCKYNFNGCEWKSYWFKKKDHEDICEYISFSCPCPGTACKWTGLLSQVMPHLSEHHKSITTLRGEDIVFLATDINLKGAVDWVMIQTCFDHHFLLVLEKQELKTGQQQFFAVVQLIGSPREAEKFRYKLELNSNCFSQDKRRLQWEATPQSIVEGIQNAVTNYDCLVFDAKMAQHFLAPTQQTDKDSPQTNDLQGNLAINVTIDLLV